MCASTETTPSLWLLLLFLLLLLLLLLLLQEDLRRATKGCAMKLKPVNNSPCQIATQ